MEKANKIIVIFFNIFLVLLIIFGITFTLMNREQFYLNEFAKYDVSKATGFTDSQLQLIITHFLDYLKGDKDSLQIIVNGEAIFSKQAIYHMEDVKTLLITLQNVLWYIFLLTIILGIYIIIKYKEIKNYFFGYYIWNFIGFISVVIIATLVAIINFDFAFKVFHRIIFWDEQKYNDAFFSSVSNYDEAEGIDNRLLIKILPEELFMDFAIIIILITILFLCLFGIYLYYNKSKEEKV